MRWRVVKQLHVTPQLDFSKGAHRFGLCLDPPSEKKSNTNFPTVPMLFPQALVFALTAGFLNCFWAPSLELCINTLGYLGGILTSPYKQKPGDGSLPRWCICRVSESWEWLALPQHVQDIKPDLPCCECSRCVSVCAKLDRWSLTQGIRHTKAVFTQLWFLRLKRPASAPFGLMWLDAGS